MPRRQITALDQGSDRKHRRGFTLIELLVVITIVIIVSAICIPPALSALSHRQASEGARLIQAALAGARDCAIRENSIAGIRLLPDPTLANTCSRIIPLTQPPAYQEGTVMAYPGQIYATAVTLGTQALVLEEAPGAWTLPPGATAYVWIPNSPTTWAWNARVGDKIQLSGAGNNYTVAGPIVTANSEGFVNWGQPGTQSPLQRTYPSPDGQTITQHPDYLMLSNGYDDNANGWVDEGWDGTDNDGDNLIDELTCKLNPLGEQVEVETWKGSLALGTSAPVNYQLVRRPMPGANARDIPLPSNIVIDLARSKIQVNALTSSVDIIVNPDGTMAPALLYSSQSSVTFGGSFFQFWLGERTDVGQTTPAGDYWLITANAKTGAVTATNQPDLVLGYAQAQQGSQVP